MKKMANLIGMIVFILFIGFSFMACDNPTGGGDTHSHNWGEWTTTATCTSPGIGTRVCQDDPTHTETRNDAALGHNYISGVCSRCGETDPTYIPPLAWPFPTDTGFDRGDGHIIGLWMDGNTPRVNFGIVANNTGVLINIDNTGLVYTIKHYENYNITFTFSDNSFNNLTISGFIFNGTDYNGDYLKMP